MQVLRQSAWYIILSSFVGCVNIPDYTEGLILLWGWGLSKVWKDAAVSKIDGKMKDNCKRPEIKAQEMSSRKERHPEALLGVHKGKRKIFGDSLQSSKFGGSLQRPWKPPMSNGFHIHGNKK